MPFESQAQNRWAHTPAGTKALGGPAKVKEWEQATDYSHLPEKTVNKGHLSKTEQFAAGGAVLGRSRDFLKTEDRFRGTKPPTVKTQDVFVKKGKGEQGRDKSEKPVKPKG